MLDTTVIVFPGSIGRGFHFERMVFMGNPRRIAGATWMAVALILMIMLTGCTIGRPVSNKPASSNPLSGKTAGTPPAGEFPLSIIDDFNRQVAISKKPARIVSLVPSHTEILFALGLDTSIVAVTSYCDYPAQAKQKENIGGFSNPSVEKIVALRPDLVLAGDLHKAVVEQLEKLNVPVIAMSPKAVLAVPEAIVTIGKATGALERANELKAAMTKRIDAVTTKVRTVADTGKPVVYYELWHEPLMTVGPGSFLHDLITLAGGANLAADTKSAYPTLSAETIISRNPGIIMYAHGAQRADQLGKRPGWANIDAVKKGMVVLFEDENIFMRAGPRIVDALEILAKTIHPGVFK